MREEAIIGTGMARFGKFAGRGSLSLAEKAELGGRVPMNTRGAFLIKGHPIGAAGSGRLVEPSRDRARKVKSRSCGTEVVFWAEAQRRKP